MLKSELIDDYNDHNFDEIKYYEVFEQTNPRVISVQKKLIEMGPYPYFGTLSFQYDLRPKYALEVASLHWRKVQKRILGRNWIKKGMAPMTGLLVLETHPIYNKKTTQRISSCHVHHLIHDHPKLARERFQAAAELDHVFAEVARGLTHKNKRWQLVSKYGTKVLPVHSSSAICGYVAKEAWDWEWSFTDRVRYLCKDGAV
jgi:hypothetical protein